MWHAGLREEIEEMFSILSVPMWDLGDDKDNRLSHSDRLSSHEGFHTDRALRLVKSTTRERLTDAQRKANRRALEARRSKQRQEIESRRRRYKTEKQREYDAKRRMSPELLAHQDAIRDIRAEERAKARRDAEVATICDAPIPFRLVDPPVPYRPTEAA